MFYRRKKRCYRRKAETKRMILDVLAGARQPMSRREIGLAIQKSNKDSVLCSVLLELVEEGYLYQHVVETAPLPTYLYEVA